MPLDVKQTNLCIRSLVMSLLLAELVSNLLLPPLLSLQCLRGVYSLSFSVCVLFPNNSDSNNLLVLHWANRDKSVLAGRLFALKRRQIEIESRISVSFHVQCCQFEAAARK